MIFSILSSEHHLLSFWLLPFSTLTRAPLQHQDLQNPPAEPSHSLTFSGWLWPLYLTRTPGPITPPVFAHILDSFASLPSTLSTPSSAHLASAACGAGRRLAGPHRPPPICSPLLNLGTPVLLLLPCKCAVASALYTHKWINSLLFSLATTRFIGVLQSLFLQN